MYACVRILLQEQNVEKFLEHQDTFLTYWQSKEPEFVAYYRQEYSKRPGKHAVPMCYLR